MKFLGSFALAPVKAVGYPFVMVPMAVLHGGGILFAFIGSLIAAVFKNIGPILALPVTVPIAVGKWTFRNCGSIALFPFNSFKVVMDELDKTKSVDAQQLLPMALISYIVGLGVAMLAADDQIHAMNAIKNIGVANLPAYLGDAFHSGWLRPAHYVFAASTALLASNVFTGLYLAGRGYYNYLTDSKPSQPEIPEAKVIAPQGHLTMFSKIQEKERVSEEEAWTLLREAAEVGANGKMKIGDMSHLVKMISDRAPTSAVVH